MQPLWACYASISKMTPTIFESCKLPRRGSAKAWERRRSTSPKRMPGKRVFTDCGYESFV